MRRPLPKRFGQTDDLPMVTVSRGDQSASAPVDKVTGLAPPSGLGPWIPWLLAAGVLGVIWWLVRKDKGVGRGLRPLGS